MSIHSVGILGAGQLARMLVLAGVPLGLRFSLTDPAADACAGQVAPLINAAWNDIELLEDWARSVDAITFDFENVPAKTAERLQAVTRVAPNSRALAVAQDRISEKMLFHECGLPTAEFVAVSTQTDLEDAIARIGAPAILKTRREGYDGKGQFRLMSAFDSKAAWDALGSRASTQGLILESFVPFDYEASVIAARSDAGEFRTWPLTRNWHVDGVLRLSLACPGLPDEVEAAAFRYAHAIAEALDYVGVFALELFVKDGKVLGNEMAPRVHNSGHWTIEGAVTSQFENHVRAVAGLPLGNTSQRFPACMLNWIGDIPKPDALLQVPGAHLHAYGKAPQPGRKVGHATMAAPNARLLRERLCTVGELLQRTEQIAPAVDALGTRG